MEAKLVIIGGDAKTTEVQLRLPTVIGRGHGVKLTLPHALVSRQHCEIYEADGHLVVRDLGSLNGTYVNSQRIEEPTVLLPGELLTIGTVTFRAVYGQGTETAAPVASLADGPSASTSDDTVECPEPPTELIDIEGDRADDVAEVEDDELEGEFKV